MQDLEVARLDESLLSLATIELCVDDTCASGALPESPMDTDVGLSGELPSSVSLYRIDQLIRVVARFGGPVSGISPRVDGQIFGATLRAANGAILAAPSWTARYERPRTNPACPDTCAAILTPN